MYPIETSTEIKNISAALIKFQAITHGVVKDQVNPHFRNRYASLEAVVETARPGLQAAGLAFTQAPGMAASGVLPISTMLIHSDSGEWIRCTTGMPITKNDAQGVGSAITYGLRYSLMAMLGLPPLDDDAEATKPQQKVTQPQAIQATAQDLQFKPTGEYIEGLPHKPDPIEGYHPPGGRPSKDVYIGKAIKRMEDFNSPSELLKWAKAERKMVWPQYEIDAHDEGGQAFVKAYQARMAALDELAEDPE